MSTPRDKLDEIWDTLPIAGGDPLDAVWDSLPGPKTPMPSAMAADASRSRFSGLTPPKKPAERKPLSALGGAKGATLSALRHIPFADEIGSALGATATLLPGSDAETFGEAYKRNLAEVEAERAAFGEEHPVISAAGNLAGFTGSLAATAPMGAVKGAALMGGLQGASNAEGAENRVAAGVLGAGFGAGLGAGANKLFKLGARKALTGLGTVGGATYGDTNAEHIGGAIAGGSIGAAGANVGGTVARKALGLLTRNPAKVLDDAGLAKYAEALAEEGKSIDDILAFPGQKGAIAADIGKKRGPIQRLGETVVTYPTKEAAELESTVLARAAFAPPAAEKAARKALGSNFRPRNDIAREAKATIRKETAPAYKELAGEEVSGEKLFQLMRDEPAVVDMWKRAQENASRRVKRGFDDAEELPDLFKTGEDGSLEFIRETVPVRGLDMIKRALREQVERTRNSPNPFTADDAQIIGKGLDDVMETAKIESPKYAATLRGFGESQERQVGKLAQRKQLSDFMSGNSRTSARLKGQESFEAEGVGMSLDPRDWVSKALKSESGKFLAGWNEKMADATAKALKTDVSTPAAREALAGRLRAQGLREEEVRRVLSVLPRIAAGGAGILGGSMLREREP